MARDVEFRVPDELLEIASERRALGGADIGEFKKWAASLPEVEFEDPKKSSGEKCCCCCCCCCGGDGGGGGSGGGGGANGWSWSPGLMLRTDPGHQVITQLSGNLAWSAPAGAETVTIEWARYGNGNVVQGFEPIGDNYIGLPAAGLVRWDSGVGQWGDMVHLRVVTDAGVSSSVHWLDADGNRGFV